jgi:hypothetical protein
MEEPTEGRDPQEGNPDVQPGGRAARGPNPDPGGEEQPGGLVPPYDGRTTGADTPSGQARAESVERQLADTKTGQVGSTESPADEQPVHADEVTDEEPESPKGVGESTTRRGEDVVDDEGQEAGRRDAGTQGESQRPVGVSDERDSSAVDPQDSQDGAPTTASGDQGG